MPNEKNKNTVKDIKERLEKARSITFADYVGLSSEQANQLRRQVKDAGGEVMISKNTLMKVALKEAENKNLSDAEKDLEGPIMAIFAFSDPIAPIKALFEFAKNFKLPRIKSAIIEGIYNNTEKVEMIKDIPSKEVLLAKFIGGLNVPISGFVSVIGGVQKKFAYAINAIAKKKSEGGAN
ncbi:50S ribosomal protein L10 [Patescibacteria group bacterium]|nr:50S ribosomal protein L10 [Patescibacteria group bacterium]MBU1953322.1 50S ribosomal protein L10 [Patescibacteria group bacterium]